MSNTSDKKANRLIHTASPYLHQHAYNPVDWYPWGSEALQKAKREDKPILVSIGYSACHWCHVMERESFEKNDVAAVMNEYFVCIKVDREERPDIDQVYMEAVQALGVNGGWPLNVFITPDQKPFFGGTYFSPQTWVQVLKNINNAFIANRGKVEDTAEELRLHLLKSDVERFRQTNSSNELKTDPSLIFQNLEKRFDHHLGGMNKAPKFVMPTIWLWLLRYHSINKNESALSMVNLTLSKMARGGLYDQLAGGFARYSVDANWFAPHFEKMLYDNAQLMSLYSEAFSITKSERYKEIVYDTFHWLSNEMTSAEGGFYSALDADSEGIEGKFYCWTYSELEEVFGKETDKVAAYFQATTEGNWEHGMNILLDTHEHADDSIKSIKEKLLQARSKRIRPGLDDKILTGWNAMMIQGLTDAYKTFSDDAFLQLASKNISFLETYLIDDGKVFRTFKGKRADTEGFLEDYAFLIQAYMALYHVTFNEEWLNKSEKWCMYVLNNFYDEAEGYFHFNSNTAEQLIARKKEIMDNVIPSSNSVMALNLYRLGILLDKEDWKRISNTMVSQLISLIESEPGYMSNWGMLLAEMNSGMAEVVIVGNDVEEKRKELHTHYLPFSLTLGTKTKSTLPLLEGRESKGGETMIYVCFNKTCKLPTTRISEALEQVKHKA
ncbi:MAG TPA: thioredoxin domain-containing protein [Chryseolinea sp.]|nr:thioredoxin domain-containing protein [Chryseolinea sp.]HPM29586.1 thioredoxin domain-containing protein [Chryseolinea sp.]